jgi:cell division septum initiation protein DivIVA
MASIWELFVVLRADNKDFKSGMQDLRKELESFVQTAASTGAKLAAALRSAPALRRENTPIRTGSS